MRVGSMLVSSLLVAAIVHRAAGQDICRPATDSHEAKTFAVLSVPFAFSGGGAPSRAHGISIGLEAASIPNVDPIDATPTACRPGKGPENANPLPGFLRPRLAVGVRGFVLEGSWVPPVEVKGVRANLWGLAVSRPIALPHGWYLDVRAHAVIGALHAPVVCDHNAVKDEQSECFHGTISDDRWSPNLYGAEVVLGTPPGPLRFHGGMGYTRLQPRFQVNFTNALGETDRRKVEVDLNRAAILGGVTYRIGTFDLTAEGYATIADAIAARFVLRVPLGS